MELRYKLIIIYLNYIDDIDEPWIVELNQSEQRKELKDIHKNYKSAG